MGGEPNATVRPSIAVGTADSLVWVLVVGVVGTPVLTPFVGRTAGGSLAVGSLAAGRIPAALVTALALCGVAFTVVALSAVGRRYTNTYRIYDDRIEVDSGLRRTETTVMPRTDVEQVTMRAGMLTGHIGGGDVEVTAAAETTNFRVDLRDVPLAAWRSTALWAALSCPPGYQSVNCGPSVSSRTRS